MKDPIAINLRKIGLKITPQRQAILKLLKGNQTHPSAERIYSEILKKYPGISFATVYNTLSKLIEAGEIRELDIDPNKKRFVLCRCLGTVGRIVETRRWTEIWRVEQRRFFLNSLVAPFQGDMEE